MNYKQKIEELTQKGIFTEEQAEKLKGSSSKEKETESKSTRYFTLELLGIVLLFLSAVYIFISVGSAENMNTVEDVAHSLNVPVQSGLTVQNSFLLVFLLLVAVLYLFLYLYAQNRYKNFWHMTGEIRQVESDIHERIVIEKELTKTLKNFLEDEKKNDVFVDTEENSTVHVMKIIEEMKKAIRSQKEKMKALQEECKRKEKLFPDTLAKLIGKLPYCN